MASIASARGCFTPTQLSSFFPTTTTTTTKRRTSAATAPRAKSNNNDENSDDNMTRPSDTTTATTTTNNTTSPAPAQQHQNKAVPTAPDTPLQASTTTTTTTGGGVEEPLPPAPTAATRKALQRSRISSAPGFIAALDQSGGSTPRALALYGVTDIRGDSDDMYRRVHDMRTRIVTSKAFTGERIIGAILFEDTVMNRRVAGLPTATYLWEEKNVVPFLKIDKGLQLQRDGVQLMKPILNLSELLARCGGDTKQEQQDQPAAAAAAATDTLDTPPGDDDDQQQQQGALRGPRGGPGDCILGTKARSVIRHADANGGWRDVHHSRRLKTHV